MKDIEYKLWILNEKPTVEMQLQRWLFEVLNAERGTDEYCRGVQLEEAGIYVRLRPYTNRYFDDCLTISAIELPKTLQNRGWFKSFLVLCCHLNPWQDVIIEDVKNTSLKEFCIRNDFTVLHASYPDTFIVDQKLMISKPVRPLADFRIEGW